MRYYLAYGSNLHLGQMQARCPNARLCGHAELSGQALHFKGEGPGRSFLTLEPADGEGVPVAIWAITEADEAALDEYEEVSSGAYYKTVWKIAYTPLVPGPVCEVEALLYLKPIHESLAAPSARYAEVCLQGYQDQGFDLAPLLRALEAVGGPV